MFKTILSASSNPVPLKLPLAHDGEEQSMVVPRPSAAWWQGKEQLWASWGSLGQGRWARRAVPSQSRF